MAELKGKVAIVTGATSGIGRGVAERLAQEGASVVACGRNEEEGAKTLSLIEAAGAKGLFHKMDITDEAAWAGVIKLAQDSFGALDILVNNAGVFFVKPLGDTSVDDFDDMYRANVESVFLGMKYAMPALRARGGGSIINVSSLMGQVGLPMATAYCASKGAVTHMTKVAAMEGARDKIRVNSLHPGIIWTEMLDKVMGAEDGEVGEALRNETPLRRHGYPKDIAGGVVFLASDRSKWMTGAELTMDGGRGCD